MKTTNDIKVSVNTLSIYYGSLAKGVEKINVLTRGTGNFTRKASVPSCCAEYTKGDDFPSWVSKTQIKAVLAYFEKFPKRRKILLCNTKKVERWMKDHPNSKLLQK